MTATICKSDIELNQGDDHEGRPFGYVHGEEGGFFFTWMPTLKSTLASVEVDEIDGDGGLDRDDVISALRERLPQTPRGRKLWTTQRGDE